MCKHPQKTITEQEHTHYQTNTFKSFFSEKINYRGVVINNKRG